MQNILSIDLEDWYHTNDFNLEKHSWDQYESRIEKSTDLILNLMAKYDAKATFFTLGCVAERYPELIRRIAAAGHEIGCHGYYHKMINTMSCDEFRKDINSSCDIIEAITGVKVISFRAPTWSIDSTNFWALEILQERGILCDSSFQPFKTPLSGEFKLPMKMFYPVFHKTRLKLLEVPSTVCRYCGIKIPFAGGAYLRFLPKWFILSTLRKVNRTRPVVVYLHPWEMDPSQPRIKGSWFDIAIHYINLKTTLPKFESLLENFEFKPIRTLLDVDDYPERSLDELVKNGGSDGDS